MLQLNVLHNQWLMLALGGGTVFVLLLLLYYRAMASSRSEQIEQASVPITGPRSFMNWLLVAVPWVLLVIILAVTAWALIMPILKSIYPPNW